MKIPFDTAIEIAFEKLHRIEKEIEKIETHLNIEASPDFPYKPTIDEDD